MFGFRRDAQGRAMLSGSLLSDLLAEARVATPAYLYDVDGISHETRELTQALADSRHLVAYAVKANSAGTIVRTVAEQGAGADVVSGAELRVALGAGVAPDRIVMSGVGKSDDELDLALSSKIRSIQVESLEEIERVAARAQALSQAARVSLRIKPDVAIDSHAHVATGHDEAKFGIAQQDLGAAWDRLDRSPEALRAVGVSSHVGSMLAAIEPYLEAAGRVCEVARARRAAGKPLEFVNFGGGFGIDYGSGPTARPAEFARAALWLLGQQGLHDLQLIVEPGRSLVGPYGVLVARIVQLKQSGSQRFAVLDAGMNDLIRPALYGARHRIEPLSEPPLPPAWRVVGPVCESADDFGVYDLGESPADLVAIRDAGAYGFVMASQYNGRRLPSEVFVTRGRVSSISESPGLDAWVARRLQA
jgi:diaminopimelate decarboxylase